MIADILLIVSAVAGTVAAILAIAIVLGKWIKFTNETNCVCEVCSTPRWSDGFDYCHKCGSARRKLKETDNGTL